MTHYICMGGCGGVSEVAKTCGAETCPKHGDLLTPCDCTDGKHYGRQDRDAGAKEASKAS
jgi:hypothetical protein